MSTLRPGLCSLNTASKLERIKTFLKNGQVQFSGTSSQGEPGEYSEPEPEKLTILTVTMGLGADRGDLDQKNTASIDGKCL